MHCSSESKNLYLSSFSKNYKAVYLDIIPRLIIQKKKTSKVGPTIGKCAGRLKSFGNSRQRCHVHLPKSILRNQDKLLKKHKLKQKYRVGILNILQMDEADGIHASEIGVLTLNVRPE